MKKTIKNVSKPTKIQTSSSQTRLSETTLFCGYLKKIHNKKTSVESRELIATLLCVYVCLFDTMVMLQLIK